MKSSRWLRCCAVVVVANIAAFARADDNDKEIEALRAKVKNGDIEAMNDLAESSGIEDAEAVRLLKTAAEKGHAMAQFNYGRRMRWGEGMEANPAEALKWFVKSAEQGVPTAMSVAARMYDEEGSPLRNLVQALRWFCAAAEKGEEDTSLEAGRRYMEGIGTKPDPVQAVKWLMMSHAEGNLEADRLLKMLIEKDPTLVARVTAKAPPETQAVIAKAKAGDAKAQLALGKLCTEGQGGLLPDLKQGAEWLQKSAAQGLAEAQFELSQHFEAGTGVEESEEKSVEWLRKSADQKYPPALVKLAIAHMGGRGVKEDRDESARLLRAAAEQGYIGAMIELGNFHRHGGYPPESDALKWYLRAAELGSGVGMMDAASVYAQNLEYDNAFKWLKIAKDKGNEEAADRIEELNQRIADAPRREAEAKQAAEKLAAEEKARAEAEANKPEKKLALAKDDFEYAFLIAPDLPRREDAVKQFSRAVRAISISSDEQDEFILSALIPKAEANPKEIASYLLAIDGTIKRPVIDRVLPASLQSPMQQGLNYFAQGYMKRRDEEIAMHDTEVRAKGGDGGAQYQMAVFYLKNPIVQNRVTAIDWLKKSAASNYADATKLLRAFGVEEYNAGVEVYKAKKYPEAMRHFILASEMGVHEGEYFVGLILKDGNGLPRRNQEEGVKWLQASMDHGDARGVSAMADRYATGQGVPKDYAKAAELYRKGAEAGLGSAMREYGRMLVFGRGVARDEKAALEWFEKAIAKEDPEAKQWKTLLTLDSPLEDRAEAAWYYSGTTIVEEAGPIFGNPEQWLAYAALLGHEEAKKLSGTWHFALHNFTEPPESHNAFVAGTEKNYVEALKQWKLAADKGSAYAMSNVARLYRFGAEGVPQDWSAAEEWYRKCADQGYLYGHVGARLSHGRVLFAQAEKQREAGKLKEAFDLYQQSAKLACGRAMTELAVCYEHSMGDFLQEDMDMALKWAKRAVDYDSEGNSNTVKRITAKLPGRAELAKAFEAHDRNERREWLQKAVDLGNSTAMGDLGRIYQMGEGVPKDEQKAMELYERGAALLDEGASIGLNLMKLSLKGRAPKPAEVAPPPEPAPAPASVVQSKALTSNRTKRSASATPAQDTTKEEKKEIVLTADDYWRNAKFMGSMKLFEDATKAMLKAAEIAETGSPETRYNLAGMIMQGSLGVPKDESRGRALLVSSAKDGFAPAQLDYARALMDGLLGFVKDQAKGEAIMKELVDHAEGIRREARHVIALMMIQGMPPVAQDKARGFGLLEQCVEEELPISKFELGKALLTGLPPELRADPARGIMLLKSVADGGAGEAMAVLAQVYERGIGVPADQKEALVWYEKAAKTGLPGATAAAEQLKAKLDAEAAAKK